MSKTISTRRIPGPPFEMKMSAIDSSYGGFYSRRVLVFRTAQSPEHITVALERGLHRLVQVLPTLAGECRMADNDDNPLKQKCWRKIIPGKGVLLHIKDLRDTSRYSDLVASDFAPEKLSDSVLMPIPLAGRAEPFDIAELQANFIDGGVLLSICISHIAGDGTAMTEILRLLAGLCKNVQDGQPFNTPASHLGTDRTPVLGLKTSSGTWTAKDHPARQFVSPGQVYQPDSNLPAIVQRIYRISPTKLAALKKDATTSEICISTNDAITGLMWRAIVVNRIASGVITDQSGSSRCYLSVNSRRALGLDSRYIGNAFSFRLVEVLIKEVLCVSSLQKLAAVHRYEVNHASKKDTAVGYLMMAEAAPSISQWSSNVGATMATTSAIITSFFHSESLLESDWGPVLGHQAQRFRCTNSGFAGAFGPVHFVLPKMPNGTAEFQIAVHSEGLEAMEKDEIFAQYVDI